MRDDLHRTVAVSKPRRKFLRVAERGQALQARLPEVFEAALATTIRQEVGGSWLARVRESFESAQGDLFPGPAMRTVLDRADREAATPGQREVCECIRGELARTPDDRRSFDRGVDHYCREQGIRNTEHVAAKTRESAGEHQARQVRQCMLDQVANTTLDIDSLIAPKRKQVRKTDILNEDFPIQLGR